MKVCGTK